MTRPAHPARSARSAGLRYVSDSTPGIRRVRTGLGFSYRYPAGTLVKKPAELRRIRSLVIPPAWTDVWICPDPLGHLQATGRDARGRKQHRYHPRWRECRDETKFERMLAFGATLPRIRARTAADLARPGLPREKVLATVVQLLEKTLIRVGNEEYLRANGSFGLTTLRDKHVDVNGSTLRFEFRGKSGKHHVVDVSDARLARIVAECRDLPGQELFQYIDADHIRTSVGSADVNAYLKDVSGEDFTAKDFRTWTATVLACAALHRSPPPKARTQIKKQVLDAIEAVAGLLGNTKTVCRKSYIHPRILDAYEDGSMWRVSRQFRPRRGTSGLAREEALVQALLQRVAGPKGGRKAA